MTPSSPDPSGEQRWRDPHPEDGAGGTPGGATGGASGAARRAERAERARAVARGLGTGARATAKGVGTGARATARGVGTSARVTSRGVRQMARGTGRAGKYAVTQANRAANAEGAGASGLARLIQMHTFNTAGDAAVAISLAGTLFFQVPTGEARGQVALFLGLTMLPFAIVAPLIGPFLDRFSHGRRWAIGATMAIRALLCLVLAGAVITESVWLFPAALGVLVASKAYGVTRAAAVPRLLPQTFTLVKANGRVSMSGIVGVAVSSPIAGLAAFAGPQWVLRYAFVLFVVATIAAIRLPEQIDSSQGEGSLSFRGGSDDGGKPAGRPGMRVPAAVAFALRANCGPRWLSGFLLMFMAFLLRENPIGDWRPEVLLAIVVGGAGAGNFLGVVAASTLKRINPVLTVSLVLVADAAVALLAALFYGVIAVALLGLIAGLGQALAKFSLDATIQRDVPERVQTSAFARSDTTLQLAWVVGGFIGIAMPLDPPRLGLGVAFAVLTAWAVYVLVTRPGRTASGAPAGSAGRSAGRSPAGRAARTGVRRPQPATSSGPRPYESAWEPEPTQPVRPPARGGPAD